MKGFGEKNQSNHIKKQKNEEILNIDKLIKKHSNFKHKERN